MTPRGPDAWAARLAGAALFLLLVLIMARTTALGTRVDHRAENSIGGGAALFSSMSTLVSWLEPLTGLVTVGVLGLGVLRGFRLRAVAGLLLLAGANGSTWLLKHALVAVLGPEAATLPSGHATLALTSSAVLAMVVPRGWRGRLYPYVGLLAALGVVGPVTALWHRPGDTLASVAVVLLCLVAVRFGVTRMSSSEVGRAQVRPAVVDVVSLAIGAVAFVGLLGAWHFGPDTSSAGSFLLAAVETLALPAAAVLVTAVATRVVPEEGDRTH